MNKSYLIQLKIDNIIPHADEQSSEKLLALWKAAREKFEKHTLMLVGSVPSNSLQTDLTLHLDEVVSLFESVISQAGSFDKYRERYAGDRNLTVGASIGMEVTSTNGDLNIDDVYQTITIFQQQFFMAMNLAFPGSCQFLGVKFIGEASHLYEAQQFDSKIFYDARKSAAQQAWPQLQSPALDRVWTWLDEVDFSRTGTAITDISKVLINMLKIAQQRYRYGARSVMLVAMQLELLLGVREREGRARMRDRAQMILGEIPEAADCFVELFQLRSNIYRGDQPIRRPALVCHSPSEESLEQIAIHNTNVELAAAIIVALIQELIKNNKSRFAFQEVLLEE